MTGITPEDLRPLRLDSIVGQSDPVRILKGLVAEEKNGQAPFPHLLLTGPPGVGKTTAAYAVARELLGDDWTENFREFETSYDRGVDAIRDDLIPWLSRMTAGDAKFKLLFIDEAEHLTGPAQEILRRAMEQNSDGTRFILAGNTPSQIIPAVRSRCLQIPFRPLSNDEIRTVLARTSETVGKPLTEELVLSIIRHSRGQARDAINAFLGGDSGTGWQRFDDEVTNLFTKKDIVRDERITRFIQFLRTEGLIEFGEILETMDTNVYERKLPTLKGYEHFIRECTTSAYKAKWVDNPLFEIRGLLFEVVP